MNRLDLFSKQIAIRRSIDPTLHLSFGVEDDEGKLRILPIKYEDVHLLEPLEYLRTIGNTCPVFKRSAAFVVTEYMKEYDY